MTFFPVSTQKFVILSLATFGIYPIYWFYGNWKRIRAASGERISPFWRASLAPLWGIPLLQAIRQQAQADRIEVRWNPATLGIAFFILTIMAFLPDPWWLLSIGLFAPLVPAVQTCEQVNDAAGNPEGPNDAYGPGNAATIIIGGVTWVLVLFGMMIRK